MVFLSINLHLLANAVYMLLEALQPHLHGNIYCNLITEINRWKYNIKLNYQGTSSWSACSAITATLGKQWGGNRAEAGATTGCTSHIQRERCLFGKTICHEVLPFLLDCKLGKSESSIVIVLSPLVSPMVDQVASLRSHDLQIWLGKSPRIWARRFE